jgi:bifunctional non-homologous end joining protein LigD
VAKKKLAAYRAKRDFNKTSEPSGKGTVGRAQYPRFIIQKPPACTMIFDSSTTPSSNPGP